MNTNETKSETPRTDKLVYEQERNFEVCWEEEYGKLETELIAAQQTILSLQQREAVLMELLKLARKQLLERNGLCKDSDNAVAIQINQALSTTPAETMVPWELMQEWQVALNRVYLTDSMPDQLALNAINKRIQSYAPKQPSKE